MAKLKNPYQNFNTYCLRTPLLPIEIYHQLTASSEVTEPQLKKLYQDPVIREALFLASPELYQELEKWADGTLETTKRNRIAQALLKYLSRMTSRCTPFGLFAGCATGMFGDNTEITPKPITDHRRDTRFDMHYLVNLTNQLSANKKLNETILWYPNSSLYTAGTQYRYIEYTYINKQRNHSIEAVTRSEYLEQLLFFAKGGKTKIQLTATLLDEDITLPEATAFVEELIANQLLVSALDPSITGDDYLLQLIRELKNLKAPKIVQEHIQEQQYAIRKLDQKLGNPPEDYLRINNLIRETETIHDPKYLFQTDLFLGMHNNQLDRQLLSSIKKGMLLFNKITLPTENTRLEAFKKAFQKRYEDREVSLATALDIEMGIGYIQEQQVSGSDPLLDDLLLPGAPESLIKQLHWDSITEILHQKLQKTHQTKAQTLILEDTDFASLEASWIDLPDTMSAMVELIIIDGKQQLVMNGCGGSSAGNLLGRFCYGDTKLNELVKAITAKETTLQPDAIHAEIVHLPESRTGNILRRPVFRDYEIPYLGASSLPIEQQLPLEDLTLVIRNGQLQLRSKKNNKQVIPHLTNAHNYSANALPIYHLLCDLQTQGLRNGIGFGWGILAEQHSFLPRVLYKELILSKAQWLFEKESLKPLLELSDQPAELQKAIKIWKSEYQLPQYVQWIEGDNTLLVNLDNITTVQMLLQSIKNRPKVILEEFLFMEDPVVKNETGGYTNQFVLAFYKEQLQSKENG